MALTISLSSGGAGAPLEGPTPIWRAAPRTTRVTALALSQHEATTCQRAAIVQEKLIEDNNLRPIAFLEHALRVARSVALVRVSGKGSATGFLISSNVLMTNNHVLPDAADASRSQARFNFQLDVAGRLAASEYFACRPDVLFHTSAALDYSVVYVEGDPGARYGVIPLPGQLGVYVGDPVAIVQHPLGEPKQIAMVDNEVAYVDDVLLQYLTDTLPGSSGSPVFNDAWELIALHHSGGWLPEPSTNSTHFRNEGIRIGAIIDDLVRAGIAG
jgi:hypothetical protein